MPQSLTQVARQLVVREAGGIDSSAEIAAGVARACAQLSSRMGSLVGTIGSNALLDRSLKLTARRFPWLAGGDAGAMPWDRLAPGLAQQPPEVALEASIELLATLVNLLVRFIGRAVTERVLADVWPEIFIERTGTGEIH